MDWVWWALAAIALLAGEIFTSGFFLLGAGLGAIVALILSFFVGFELQMLGFIIATGGLIVGARPLYLRWLGADKSQPGIATNVDALIEKTGLVTKTIDNQQGGGLVRIRGEDWTALSENDEVIEEGNNVLVVAVKGVKLIVMAQS